MKECRSCRAALGPLAETCPHCGQPTRIRIFNQFVTLLLWAFIVAVLVSFISVIHGLADAVRLMTR
jgi:hypothetical protein